MYFFKSRKGQLWYLFLLGAILLFTGLRIGFAYFYPYLNGQFSPDIELMVTVGLDLLFCGVLSLVAILSLSKKMVSIMEEKAKVGIALMIFMLAIAAGIAIFFNSYFNEIVEQPSDFTFPAITLLRIFSIILVTVILYFIFRNNPGVYTIAILIFHLLNSILGSGSTLGSFLSRFFDSRILDYFLDLFTLSYLFAIGMIAAIITYFKNRKKISGRELSKRILRNYLLASLIFAVLPIIIALVILGFALGESGGGILVLVFGD